MERSSVCQIVSSFPNYESLLEQSSILLQTCNDPQVSNQAVHGMEASSGVEENHVLQYLDTFNFGLEYQQEQSEVIIMPVDDPDLIRLMAVESNELSASSLSHLNEIQTFLELPVEEDGLQSQVELNDVDWVPPEPKKSRSEPLSGRKEKGTTAKKHRKGRLQTPLDEIRKENQANVKRCREYRSQKKQKEEKKLTALQQLELENMDLKRKEEEVKEKRDRVQNAYLALINLGRIKFPVGF